MPAKKSRSLRKTARGHRQSNAGTILPPLDVRSSSSLSEFKKRIKAGPLTIVLVYADWCGHCHEMRPHFDAAAKSANRTLQAVSVNETMLDKVNDAVHSSINQKAKPIEVEGYPTIMLIDHEGNKVSDINAVKNTEVMTNIMTTPTQPNQANNKANNKANNMANNMANSMANNKNRILNMGQTTMNESIGRIKNADVGESKLLGSMVGTPVTPPNPKNDAVIPLRGGSLFGAISQSVYTLAPAAVLLATAATMMKKGSKKHARHYTKKRHTKRRS